MSREASRLGRRPKRLKEVGGEGSGGGARVHLGNLPIAPYPCPQELYKLRMAELQKILQSNGTFKAELMQAFLSAAKVSFQEHSKSTPGESPAPGKGKQHKQTLDPSGPANLNHTLLSSGSPVSNNSALSDAQAMDNSMGLGCSVDSPSSLHSPGGSMIDFSNLGALENFLFDQGNMPATPGTQSSLDAAAELTGLNSPFNLNNVTLDAVSDATFPLSDFNLGSPLAAPLSVSSVSNGTLSAGQEGLGPSNDTSLNMNLNVTSPGQYQPQAFAGYGGVMVKTEFMSEGVDEPSTSSYPSCSLVKLEPLSPEASNMSLTSPIAAIAPGMDMSTVSVSAIVEEVRQTPSQTRRVLIDQVTDAIVEAHITTTLNTYGAIQAAKDRLNAARPDTDDIARNLAQLKLEANNMWQMFMTSMVPEITQVVKFCKKLPGFTEIEQDDQIRLIKQGAFEVMLARFSLLVDHQDQTMLDPTHQMRAKRVVIRQMPMGQFLDEFFSVAKEFNPLKLSDGEIGLFTAILIISPTRKNLTNVRTVKKIQALFQQALFYLMKHNHADTDQKFSQLMSLIPMFHRINEEHFKALTSIRMELESGKTNIMFPDLHQEVFDGSV